jgi:chlorobactene glucosyltransferase
MLLGLPLILWLLLAIAVANLLVFRGLRRAPAIVADAAAAPLVSLLVPARDEARNIRECVASLLAQEHPNCELLVLDDGSTDGTGEIVQELFATANVRGMPVRLLTGAELPPGWSGKNWACHQLAQAARGDFLLFTDADTAHEPGAVAAAVAHAREVRADLLTAWPRQVTRTLGERLVIPVIYLVGFVFCAHWLVALLQRFPRLARMLGPRLTRGLGGANGQFLLFTRAAYDRIGGHESVRAAIAEDVALGREITAQMPEGMRLCVCEAVEFSRVRMYRSFAEVWAGFAKNLRGVFGREGWLFWVFLLGLWVFLLAPTVHWLWRPAAWPQAVAVLGLRAVVTWRFRTGWVGVLLHPLAIALVIAIALRSWWLTRGPGVQWKGRLYRAEP